MNFSTQECCAEKDLIKPEYNWENTTLFYLLMVFLKKKYFSRFIKFYFCHRIPVLFFTHISLILPSILYGLVVLKDILILFLFFATESISVYIINLTLVDFFVEIHSNKRLIFLCLFHNASKHNFENNH